MLAQQPEPQEGAGPARHAQVVPSFVMPGISRVIEYWGGRIDPAELLRWERPSDLTESARRELRNMIIRRLRVRADWMWEQPTGVRLEGAWRERLIPGDVRGIEAVLARYPDRPLQNITLGEFRRAFAGPLERQLAVLARLEALYWQPPARPAPAGPRIPLHLAGPSEDAPVPVVELRDLSERVLALPWLAGVSPEDLRFAYPGPGPLPQWLREQLQGQTVTPFTAGLLKKLDAANKMTAAEEVLALTLAAGEEGLPRKNPEAAQRWPAMFLARHLSAEGTGQTLVEVGEKYGVTRERVRQICEAFEEVFARSQAAAPALDRVLQAVARIAPCSIEEANEQLARFIGEGAGVEALIAWARVLGRKDVPIECHRARWRLRGQMVDTTVVERAEARPWVRPLIAHVSRDTSMFGCTNILRVAGLLALKEGVAPGQEAIEAALEGCAGFRWLDKETGWFALGESDASSVGTRVRKIMAVAHHHVGADEIAAALASDDMMIYRETQSLGLAVPPVHVLRELMRPWPWLKVIQKGRFMPAADFDASGILSEPEKLAVQVIEQHDGVACRFELREAIEAELQLTSVAVSAMLGSSPIFERLEHGIYRLIGRRVGDAALNAARERLHAKNTFHSGSKPAATRPNEFIIRISEASLTNEQHNVPARLHPQLAGKRFPLHAGDGRVLGEVRITQSGALKGLNRLLNPKAGDILRVTVEAHGLRVAQAPAADALPADCSREL